MHGWTGEHGHASKKIGLSCTVFWYLLKQILSKAFCRMLCGACPPENKNITRAEMFPQNWAWACTSQNGSCCARNAQNLFSFYELAQLSNSIVKSSYRRETSKLAQAKMAGWHLPVLLCNQRMTQILWLWNVHNKSKAGKGERANLLCKRPSAQDLPMRKCDMSKQVGVECFVAFSTVERDCQSLVKTQTGAKQTSRKPVLSQLSEKNEKAFGNRNCFAPKCQTQTIHPIGGTPRLWVNSLAHLAQTQSSTANLVQWQNVLNGKGKKTSMIQILPLYRRHVA